MLLLPELNHLLQYKNPRIIARYQKDHPNNKLSAEEALTEILKYFWVSQKHKLDCQANPNNEELKFTCAIHAEMHEIDDMWHTFLLFTHDYHDFCMQYFGKFIHHDPNTETAPPDEKKFETDFERYLSYIYDNLGEETVCKWFAEYV